MAEEFKKILKEVENRIIRHFDVVSERTDGKIQILAEQIAANAEKLEEHNQRFDRIEDDLTIIKTDLGSIKQDLKQKVSYDDFAALERRVIALESKASR